MYSLVVIFCKFDMLFLFSSYLARDSGYVWIAAVRFEFGSFVVCQHARRGKYSNYVHISLYMNDSRNRTTSAVFVFFSLLPLLLMLCLIYFSFSSSTHIIYNIALICTFELLISRVSLVLLLLYYYCCCCCCCRC